MSTTEGRGEIVHVGDWDAKTDSPVGWAFRNAPIGMQIFTDGRPTLIAGYTIDELRAIHQDKTTETRPQMSTPDTIELPDFQTYDELITWATGQRLMVNMGPCPCGKCGRNYYRPTERGVLAMVTLLNQRINDIMERAGEAPLGELGTDLRQTVFGLLITPDDHEAMARIGNSM